MANEHHIVIHRFNAAIDAYVCCINHKDYMLHVYPATVDTALTMIHLDVYVRVANVIIMIIFIIARLTRLGRRPSYAIVIRFFFYNAWYIKLHYWQQDIK